MTGLGRSPSSWVQSPQGRDRTQPFELGISPAHSGMTSNSFDHSSPNYFGMATHNGNQTSNPGLPTQKSWPMSQPQSAHTPKVHVHPQELVSKNLVNMLKTEPEASRIRRESTFNEPFRSNNTNPGSKHSPSHPLVGFSYGQGGQISGAGKSSVSARGKSSRDVKLPSFKNVNTFF